MITFYCYPCQEFNPVSTEPLQKEPGKVVIYCTKCYAIITTVYDDPERRLVDGAYIGGGTHSPGFANLVNSIKTGGDDYLADVQDDDLIAELEQRGYEVAGLG